MMTLNARLLGLLGLALVFFVTGIFLVINRNPTISSVTRPAAFFAAPVAEGGLLFSALMEQVSAPRRSAETTFAIDEVITPVLAGRVLAMSDAELARVELNSVGGDVEASIAIANRLRAAGSHTFVASGAKCFSACTVIFQGGVERSAGEDALFLLHYAVQKSANPERDHMGSIWGTVALIEAMIDLGADMSIYEQMPGYGDWLLSSRQAIDLRLVQRVVPNAKTADGALKEKAGA
jgi:ATP-dependent protease ClpP protease subunit